MYVCFIDHKSSTHVCFPSTVPGELELPSQRVLPIVKSKHVIFVEAKIYTLLHTNFLFCDSFMTCSHWGFSLYFLVYIHICILWLISILCVSIFSLNCPNMGFFNREWMIYVSTYLHNRCWICKKTLEISDIESLVFWYILTECKLPIPL